ncbi:MAG TPA: YdeI/OmpD-associated family protein [Propionibacteriaceae bacterium]|nr:YdeI/OmpD-associated family protein [Propionibacteriaceae bacterium]
MTFSAEVLSMGQGGGHALVVPKEVAATFASKRPPVLAHVNGVEYRSRLAVYGGQSYLGLRKDLLKQLGVGVGELVEVELVEDNQERVVVEPAELTAALAENPAARAAYDQLPFTHRNEYARWIDEGKKPETRADRVAKTIKRLTQPR